MAAELVAAARDVKPDLEIVLHAVPWRRNDYGGAIRSIAGQDNERLAKRVDTISPMAYAHMLRRRRMDPARRPPGRHESRQILPSIQVQEVTDQASH
jgi:hypothetical protein